MDFVLYAVGAIAASITANAIIYFGLNRLAWFKNQRFLHMVIDAVLFFTIYFTILYWFFRAK